MVLRFLQCGCLLPLVLGMSVRPADAAVIYSQLPLNGGDAQDSIASIGPQAADNFTLPRDSDVSDIHWWGTYEVDPPASDDFTVDFWSNEALFTLPSRLLATRSLAGVSRTATALVDADGNPVFKYDAVFDPVSLAGSTPYWVSIYSSASWRWAASDQGDGLQAAQADGWFRPDITDLAFQLTESVSAVPEPASVAVWSLVGGMIGLGLAIWRKRAE